MLHPLVHWICTEVETEVTVSGRSNFMCVMMTKNQDTANKSVWPHIGDVLVRTPNDCKQRAKLALCPYSLDKVIGLRFSWSVQTRTGLTPSFFLTRTSARKKQDEIPRQSYLGFVREVFHRVMSMSSSSLGERMRCHLELAMQTLDGIIWVERFSHRTAWVGSSRLNRLSKPMMHSHAVTSDHLLLKSMV